ncbi:cysteine--tRNA ligase [Novosphingobium sp. YJ-S2-02]|uniref:Cysteine--tRNA ligase n=1 Tax=Novosphingobium aureum TaxID=2792964 RepID=A0A931HCH5_9SPHN|nr:cysteine--tRNA ligase [Novosphingobium aureum]MBH0113532.1 cysteine--tRNA ligase [Novosphingobium aureum]
MTETTATPELTLFNSLTRQLEPFRPVHAGEARVYTCGPTVYNYPHIGNMRAYVFADILGRTLSHRGLKLTHVINITDVGHLTDDGDQGEDKMEKMAAQKAQSIWDIARHYTEAYWADIKALNIRQPAHWSIATDYVEQMIDFARQIADAHCYELESGLYFDVSSVADYGRLARAVTEEGEGRIETVEGKRNAADFAIWRKTPAGEKRQMEWDSPWGKGAPGWHLECSVMSGKLLGFPFDIHTGGIDHREIHHPNEIAQNQAFCCKPGDHCGLDVTANSGANIWMHNNFLVERSGKMSKSSGEFLRLQLLIDKGYHPLGYRMMCLQAHYRSELEFSWDGLAAALTRLKRMIMAAERLKDVTPGAGTHPKLAPMVETFEKALADDLNTPIALTALEDVLAAKKVDPAIKRALVERMDAVLGLDLFALTRAEMRLRPLNAQIEEAEIEDVLARRKQARADKDFATSDALRDELTAKGVEVMDGDPLGWEWKLG